MTRSKTRLNPLEGTTREEPTEEEVAPRSAKSKQTNQTARIIETKKTVQRNVKRKPPTVAPVSKMVDPYTPQQFFDQPANITNGQLLAMNPKFGLTIAKQLRKPVVRKKEEEPEKKPSKKVIEEETPEEETPPEPQDLMQVNTSKTDDKTSALYCDASINHIRFPLIIDSGSAGCIVSLSLLKDLEMEITRASKTVMVNVNGER